MNVAGVPSFGSTKMMSVGSRRGVSIDRKTRLFVSIEPALTVRFVAFVNEEPPFLFRVYRGTPPHYHAQCDEYLYVLSGRGTFWMKDASTKAEFGPGQLLFFERGTVHALPEILAEPLCRRGPHPSSCANARSSAARRPPDQFKHILHERKYRSIRG